MMAGLYYPPELLLPDALLTTQMWLWSSFSSQPHSLRPASSDSGPLISLFIGDMKTFSTEFFSAFPDCNILSFFAHL